MECTLLCQLGVWIVTAWCLLLYLLTRGPGYRPGPVMMILAPVLWAPLGPPTGLLLYLGYLVWTRITGRY